MTLTPGTRLGPYVIVAVVGAGGMGEVYRARDARLGRDVALKILPETFANDPNRLMRVEREARTLAALMSALALADAERYVGQPSLEFGAEGSRAGKESNRRH